jgi:hypothetical protein
MKYQLKWNIWNLEQGTADKILDVRGTRRVTIGNSYAVQPVPVAARSSLEPEVIPTAQVSTFTLQYFPYYV